MNESMNMKSLQGIVWVSFFAALLAVSAFITIPVGPVPFSALPLTLFLTALILGSKKAAIAMAIYIFLGLVGFPFFAGGKSGLATLMSPTGGFLMAYIPTIYLAGLARGKKLVSAYTILMLSLIFLYICGVSWLKFSLDISIEKAFALGCAPFFIPDVLKFLLAHSIYTIVEKQKLLKLTTEASNK